MLGPIIASREAGLLTRLMAPPPPLRRTSKTPVAVLAGTLHTAEHRDVIKPARGVPYVPMGQHPMDTVSTVSRSTIENGTEMLTIAVVLGTATYVVVLQLGGTTSTVMEVDDFARPNAAGTLKITAP